MNQVDAGQVGGGFSSASRRADVRFAGLDEAGSGGGSAASTYPDGIRVPRCPRACCAAGAGHKPRRMCRWPRRRARHPWCEAARRARSAGTVRERAAACAPADGDRRELSLSGESDQSGSKGLRIAGTLHARAARMMGPSTRGNIWVYLCVSRCVTVMPAD